MSTTSVRTSMRAALSTKTDGDGILDYQKGTKMNTATTTLRPETTRPNTHLVADDLRAIAKKHGVRGVSGVGCLYFTDVTSAVLSADELTVNGVAFSWARIEMQMMPAGGWVPVHRTHSLSRKDWADPSSAARRAWFDIADAVAAELNECQDEVATAALRAIAARAKKNHEDGLRALAAAENEVREITESLARLAAEIAVADNETLTGEQFALVRALLAANHGLADAVAAAKKIA